METKVAIIKDINKDIKFIEEAARVIKSGGIVAFPTETVYGLGANALEEEAVKKIFIAKGRPQDNPLIVHVCSKDISNLVKKVPKVAQELINKFWPGPLTIILEKKDIIPNMTSADLDTIGIRMPNSEIALKLIELSDRPIAAPSANISGRPSPTEVERCIDDLDGRVDYIIGGESSDIGVESTIIDCTVNPPLILRPGGITLEMLREIDSNIDIDKALKSKPSADLKPKAPGMKYRHYAPKAHLKIIRGKNEKTIEIIREMLENYIEKNSEVAVLTTDENLNRFDKGNIISLGSEKDLNQIAKNLFEALRKCDDLGVQYILCQGFEEKGVGVAIMNRLSKAAGYDIIDV
ncbi:MULTISPECIES: L-threonylcarbamoyladenylate synthase [unclassified Clostridium]|uniref:L-threonylcarbamoyladenylate synthase n=1 Tax=Clostridium TaxID=1485 RepID=UPI001C8B8B07|nr:MULTISPECIES: L-threonylcarbamoyladenylate synthase [unclassified Clostridium]MBX9138170.1 threonylcarbamoyl-AMP synthase [Clostridium sp. K12(2020)]MBX9142910.1 threonylcarbamoyl-AMP synthase [Clostridium sp. K13]MDU2290131.1 L-threonylcarbamoyladenylate synthase [Clostridium celatum]MDU4323939.1 L-threonylcarbamoyladenylate synthase [Clostridium celatum]